MRNVHSRFSDPNLFVSDSGCRYHDVRTPHINDDGTISLVVTGKQDIQEMINAEVPLTDMAYIISRLDVGDSSVLHPGEPMYGDFTQLPKNNIEALNMVLNAELSFNQLPLDVRDKFNQDWKKWIASAGSDSWLSAMGANSAMPSEAQEAPNSEEN